MRVLISITALVFLLSPTAQAGTTTSPEICQRMVLSLLDDFDVNNPESKQQIITFAVKCMPESVLSGHPEGFTTLQLKKNNRKRIATRARI